MAVLAWHAEREAGFRLRLFLILLAGLVAMGAVLVWRSSLLLVSDYQEFPVTHAQRQEAKQNEALREIFKIHNIQQPGLQKSP